MAHELAATFRGEVLTPGDAGYDEARALWNGVIDKRPAVIARAADTGDVSEAIRFARENGLAVTARGGGHGVAGNALTDGGLVVDLSAMRNVEVDRDGRTARADGGVTLGELDAATQAHGLAAPVGVVSKTGIAGLTLVRRHRVAAPEARPLGRQPRLARGRRRGRPRAHRERDGERGALLGASRRRRELRRGDVVRVPAASGRAGGLRRIRPVPGRGSDRRPSRARRVHGERARRGEPARAPRFRAARGAVPRGSPRRAVSSRSRRPSSGRSTRAKASSRRCGRSASRWRT